MSVGVIGRLAGQGTPYGQNHAGQRRQRRGDAWQRFGGSVQSDRVELSEHVPSAFTTEEMRKAADVADTMAMGKTLRGADAARMRMDRIFAALAALQAMHANSTVSARRLPPGLPKPSAAELEAAYRRLSQRLEVKASLRQSQESVEELRQNRRDLLERFRMQDFEVLAARL